MFKYVGTVLVVAACVLACSSDPKPGVEPEEDLTPHFDAIPALSLQEDAAPWIYSLTGLGVGEREGSAASLLVEVSADAPAVLDVSVQRNGEDALLTVIPLPNASGSATITVKATEPTEGKVFSRTFSVQVVAVNDPPLMASLGNLQMTSGQSLTVPLTALSPGGGPDEQAQPLSLSVSATTPGLFQSLTAVMGTDGRSGELRLTAAEVGGTTNVTLVLSDGQSEQSTRSVAFSVQVVRDTADVTMASVSSGAQSGCVTVNYVVASETSLLTDVLLEVDSGSGYVHATTRTAGTLQVSSSPEGVAHSLIWRSSADLPPADLTGVRLRVTAVKGAKKGGSAQITGVSTDNGAVFAATENFDSGEGIQQAIVADMNGDGIQDVLSADSTRASFSLMKGKPDGTYESPVQHVSSPTLCGSLDAKPFSLNAADFNEDSHLDVLVVHENCQTVAVLLANGVGGFLPYQSFAVGQNALFAAQGDFNHDGHVDIAVVNYGTNDVSVLMGTGLGTFQPQVRYSVGINPNKIQAGDFNNDGWLDLVTADMADNQISVLTNDQHGAFTQLHSFPAGLGPRNMAVGDLDQNGFLDVITANPGPDNDQSVVAVILQTAVGVFAAPVPYTVQLHPRSVAIADINGDGHLDAAIANVFGNSASVLMGHGDGTFVAAKHFATGSGPHSVVLADMNADGRPDLVTGNPFSTNFSVLANQTPFCAP